MKKNLFQTLVLVGLTLTSAFAKADLSWSRTNYPPGGFTSVEDASAFCATMNARLPTARELANLSQSYGARGIIETPLRGKQHPTIQPEAAAALRDAGADTFGLMGNLLIDFFYSSQGYRGLTDEANADFRGLLSSTNYPYGGSFYFYFLTRTSQSTARNQAGLAFEDVERGGFAARCVQE
jgi:hypothetical protein